MKYFVLLALTVEADPADFRAAAENGFQAIADEFNSGEEITIHLLPQDGSAEAILQQSTLNACFQAHTIPSF